MKRKPKDTSTTVTDVTDAHNYACFLWLKYFHKKVKFDELLDNNRETTKYLTDPENFHNENNYGLIYKNLQIEIEKIAAQIIEGKIEGQSTLPESNGATYNDIFKHLFTTEVPFLPSKKDTKHESTRYYNAANSSVDVKSGRTKNSAKKEEKTFTRFKRMIGQKKIMPCIALSFCGWWGETAFNTINHLINRAVEGIMNNQHDFKMSEETKKKLFSENGGTTTNVTQDMVRQKITEMMEKSRETICPNKDLDSHLDKEERKAIWFDFIKMQLTDHVLNTIDHNTFNISCKDGIDRAWAHSIYYNEQRNKANGNSTILEEKHDQMIDTPALAVKGRGMNKHIGILEPTREKANTQSTGSTDESQHNPRRPNT